MMKYDLSQCWQLPAVAVTGPPCRLRSAYNTSDTWLGTLDCRTDCTIALVDVDTYVGIYLVLISSFFHPMAPKILLSSHNIVAFTFVSIEYFHYKGLSIKVFFTHDVCRLEK